MAQSNKKNSNLYGVGKSLLASYIDMGEKSTEDKRVQSKSNGTVKNYCAKTVDKGHAYEVWSNVTGSWTWYVLKKWQVDDNKPCARWFCLVVSPMTGERGEMGDVYVAEVKRYARRVK